MYSICHIKYQNIKVQIYTYLNTYVRVGASIVIVEIELCNEILILILVITPDEYRCIKNYNGLMVLSRWCYRVQSGMTCAHATVIIMHTGGIITY